MSAWLNFRFFSDLPMRAMKRFPCSFSARVFGQTGGDRNSRRQK